MGVDNWLLAANIPTSAPVVMSQRKMLPETASLNGRAPAAAGLGQPTTSTALAKKRFERHEVNDFMAPSPMFPDKTWQRAVARLSGMLGYMRLPSSAWRPLKARPRPAGKAMLAWNGRRFGVPSPLASFARHAGGLKSCGTQVAAG